MAALSFFAGDLGGLLRGEVDGDRLPSSSFAMKSWFLCEFFGVFFGEY